MRRPPVIPGHALRKTGSFVGDRTLKLSDDDTETFSSPGSLLWGEKLLCEDALSEIFGDTIFGEWPWCSSVTGG